MCGWCGRQVVQMPEGDWACPPCRDLMNRVVVGPPALFEWQMRRFARLAMEPQGRLFS